MDSPTEITRVKVYLMRPCRGAASVAPLLPKGKVKDGACVVLLQLAARIVVSNLHKNAKKSFSET